MNNIRTVVFPFVFSIAIIALLGCSESNRRSDLTTSPEDMSETTPTQTLDAPVGQLGKVVIPLRYRLELTIDPHQKSFSGSVEIDLQVAEPISQFWLHGKDLAVDDIYLVDARAKRIAASYEQMHETGVSLVSLAEPIEAGSARLHVHYARPFNDKSPGLFRADRGDEVYAATQFQAIAARQVFPGFDEPAFKVSFDITLITRADHVAITNTPEVSVEALADGLVRRVFETTRPLPTYLLAFAVGDYDLVDYGSIAPNQIRERALPLRAIAARGQGVHLDYALKHTAGLLEVLENYFGTPYPYQKLDLIAMPISFGGAMENAGAITYSESLLLLKDNASLDQRRFYAIVHAHELAHMWFGDLVTPDWWTDIWLNESFATWMMAKAASEYWPEGEFDRFILEGALRAMGDDSLAAARQIREPVTHNSSIGDAFDGITYRKGGGVLSMLERYTGEDAFRAGIQLHMDRYADGVANAEDFIDSVAEGSGRSDIESAFNSFIEQPGVPWLKVSVDCSDGSDPALEIHQSRYAPLVSTIDREASQWRVPMCVSYQAGDTVQSQCTMLREKRTRLSLASDDCPQWVLPNADGAGYYRFALDDNHWQSLIANVDRLNAAEAMALADSLDAAFWAGTVSATTYVDGMTVLVNHDTWDVVEASLDRLENIKWILDVKEHVMVNAALSHLARPRFERLALEQGTSAELLQPRLQRFLMMVARDPELRGPVKTKAVARIGLDGEPDPSIVPPAELRTTLSIGVQDIGETFFDVLMLQAIESEDRVFRIDALKALASAEDPRLSIKLQQLILSGRLQGYEPIRLLFEQMGHPATSERTRAWVMSHYEEIIALVPESSRGPIMAGLGSGFCSNAHADEWEAFIASHADELPGHERPLAQATELVRLCAATREALAADLLAALGNAIGE